MSIVCYYIENKFHAIQNLKLNSPCKRTFIESWPVHRMDEIPELDDRKLTLPVYRVIWMTFKSFEMYETELGPPKES